MCAPEGVKITFLTREALLVWLASNAAVPLHALTHRHERDAVTEGIIEGWSYMKMPTVRLDPPSGKRVVHLQQSRSAEAFWRLIQHAYEFKNVDQ